MSMFKPLPRLLLRTNAGTDHQSRTSYDTASNATGAYAALNYIALTEDTAAPSLASTVLSGELNAVGGGLNRTQATYAHTNGTNVVTLTRTFTKNISDGGASDTRTPAKAGLLNAASVGTLGYETLIPSPPALISGDSVAVTWTFTL